MIGPSDVPAFLGLGGNIGEPARAMADALALLDAAAGVEVVRVSGLYRTPPWGKVDQPDFLNAAAEIRTRLAPEALLELCLSTERALKRERRERWGPRPIDIDILLFGDRRISIGGLEIPHPRMLERAFVLVPLAEIAPDLEVDGLTVAEHLGRLDASGIVGASAEGSWWRRG
ncbi:2-amino-4-hydroxy-6-hydroxymethyldihydropteridine diphosphokinase [Chelativorans intermedius]|uniref:2-amino-4-hydroxy-6-hydroxymethyldihydropteridine pyrophosphokinase n=1 Tax=Chelativorans intermedius TaxID=515947 RepID=A0ABV6D312_9HYPH|nr:2-amino-4-hydroxy-6-hydroxymethyldihydropteridine diphosphokinase [Chelativorans intermedius]MCT8998494.1 2-amino-4-hydroxy-6-hydroxymethyldihydropteridine diphosphokinase [Chelativorans intermedius]